MKTRFGFISLLGIVVLAASALPARSQSVKLVSVETNCALPANAKDVVFGQHPDAGVEVKAGFLIQPEAGASLIDIDEKKCKIKEVTDAESGQASSLKVKFGSFPHLSKEDGGPGFHELTVTNPAAEAKGRIKVTGTVHVTVSKGLATEKPGALAMASGLEIKAGGLTLKAKGVKIEDGKLCFQLESGKSLKSIKAIRFLDAQGKEVKSRRSGSSTMSVMGMFSETWEMEVETTAKDLAVEIDFFKDLEEKDIPIEFVLPAGF